MRNYMMERFLERISLSSYRGQIYPQGRDAGGRDGRLDARSTMDLDATVKGANVSVEDVENMMARSSRFPLTMALPFQVKSISEIMDEGGISRHPGDDDNAF